MMPARKVVKPLLILCLSIICLQVNAIFDPFTKQWVAENKGVTPDMEQKGTAAAVAQGRDLQLEKAVEETLKLLEKEPCKTHKSPIKKSVC